MCGSETRAEQGKAELAAGHLAASSPPGPPHVQEPPSVHLKPDRPTTFTGALTTPGFYGPVIYFLANNCFISKSILNYLCIIHIKVCF